MAFRYTLKYHGYVLYPASLFTTKTRLAIRFLCIINFVCSFPVECFSGTTCSGPVIAKIKHTVVTILVQVPTEEAMSALLGEYIPLWRREVVLCKILPISIQLENEQVITWTT